jgi:Fe-S-cluster containining protein
MPLSDKLKFLVVAILPRKRESIEALRPPARSTMPPDLAPTMETLHSGRREDLHEAVDLALHRVLDTLHVAHHFDEVALRVKALQWFRALEGDWALLDPPSRSHRWQELMARLIDISYASRPYCVRCGECCRGGSPSLHLEDLGLWSQGLLSPRDLFTLRKGELVHLNIEGSLGPLPEELVKIKPHPETAHCVFYREQDCSCSIYEHRPLQCRVQACWAPGSLKELWHTQKLTRRDLLRDDQEMLEIMRAHDDRCAPEKLEAAHAEWCESASEAALKPILDQLRYDTALRALVTERLGLADEELQFFFGRSLIHLVRAYGLRVDRDGDGTYRLVLDE